MPFWIQVGNPTTVSSPAFRKDTDLPEALQAMFPMETEDAIVAWNHVLIPVSYKYDLSVILEDVLELLNRLVGKRRDSFSISFGSDTFQTKWQVTQVSADLRIESHWSGVSGSIEPLLNQRSLLEIPVTEFLSEWKELLRMVLDCCQRSGLSEMDCQGIRALHQMVRQIPGNGRLYRNH